MTAALTVADRLADFVCARQDRADDEVLHDAKRLLLNQLKASAEACLQPEGRRWLEAAATPSAYGRSATRLWWSGAFTTAERAGALHRRLLGLLDFGDTHLPTLRQLTATLLPGLLAQAGHGRQDGRALLEALAIGLEVDIACARLLPLRGDSGSSPGALAARCCLAGLDRAATAAALATAACPVDAEALDEALEGQGRDWHLREIALHCRPVPVQALAPLDAVLELRSRAGARVPQRMQLWLSAQAWPLAQSQDGSDLRHCMAAAWRLSQFSADERQPACIGDPAMQALRAGIELRLDGAPRTLASCRLAVQFEDGGSDEVEIDAFLGSAGQPLSDSQLSELFRNSVEDLLLPLRAGQILQALWGLDYAADARSLLRLLRKPG